MPSREFEEALRCPSIPGRPVRIFFDQPRWIACCGLPLIRAGRCTDETNLRHLDSNTAICWSTRCPGYCLGPFVCAARCILLGIQQEQWKTTSGGCCYAVDVLLAYIVGYYEVPRGRASGCVATTKHQWSRRVNHSDSTQLHGPI